MLRFNSFEISRGHLEKLYFNTSYVAVQPPSNLLILEGFFDFNTSYVAVQPLLDNNKSTTTEFQYILCCGSTKEVSGVTACTPEFQYILCCGSTAAIEIRKTAEKNFNTSYVAVQQHQPKQHS